MKDSGPNFLAFCLQIAVGMPLFLGGPCFGTVIISMLLPECGLGTLVGFGMLPTGIMLAGSCSRVVLSITRAPRWWTALFFQIGPILTGLLCVPLLVVDAESTLLAVVVPPVLGAAYGSLWLVLLMAGIVMEPDQVNLSRRFGE